MRGILFSLIFIILLSGCVSQVGQIDKGNPIKPEEQPPLSQQVTSDQVPIQEAKVTTETDVSVTRASQEQTEPKTYQISVSQGIGVIEGTG